jgi:hypothetical protein
VKVVGPEGRPVYMPRSKAEGMAVPTPERPDPLVKVVGEDGELSYVPRSKAEGMTAPGAPDPLVKVQNQDGSVTYVPRSEAAGMAAPATRRPQPKFEARTLEDGTRVQVDTTTGRYFPMPAAPKPGSPTVQTFEDGEERYKAQWDPQQNAWNEIAGTRAPRWQDRPDNAVVKTVDPETGKTVFTRRTDAVGREAPATGAGGRASVFEQKRRAWLDAHPGDTEGALKFAGGRAEMDPAKARATARNMAIKEMGGGFRRPNPQDVDRRAEEIYRSITGQGAPASPPAAPAPTAAQPSATAPAAPPPGKGTDASELPPQAASRLREGYETTFGNGQVWTMRSGQPVRVK